MLMSMTGFGRSSGSFEGKKITVEVRSLNSKGLDINTRTANLYREVEPDIRKLINENLERGKIDLSINLENIGTSKSVSLNIDLAKAYYNEFKKFNDEIGEKSVDYLSVIARIPDVFNNEKAELNTDEKTFILQLIQDACLAVNKFRRQEGKVLEQDFTEKITKIKQLLAKVPPYESERITTIKERIQKGLEEIETNFDSNRLEQELIFYIEKLDISEEKLRLSNHLDYFLETMNASQNTGKKLGFITQEIGREINTLGSKSNHAEMQKLVVEMKDNLEKIKEQVLNTL